MIENDCYVSVIAPLRNDADIVHEFVDELVAVVGAEFENYEVVLVDDASTDETPAVVDALLSRHENIRLIRLSRRFGQEVAIAAGLDSVIGDFVVVMLPDSDPPALVPEMIDIARSGAESVYGLRQNRTADPLFLRFGAWLFYWYCNKFLRLDLPTNSTHFRVLSRRVVNALNQIKDRGRYLRALGEHVGYGSQGFPYQLIQRRAEPRSKSLVEAIQLAVDIIVSNSLKPLRLVTWLGMGIAGLNAVYVVTVSMLAEDSAVATAAAIHGGLMFALLFSILAVVGEYVGRIVEQSKGRPLYYVMDEKNSTVVLMDGEKKNVVTESTEG